MTIQNQFAGIRNVAMCYQALDVSINRNIALPGILAFYGASGYGKSVAASWAANQFRAYHVQCQSVWTRKELLSAILFEMGIPPERTLSQMMKQINAEMSASNRPLFIDEADYLADKNWLPMVMDIYEGSQVAVMLIGEERLPSKIGKFEKIHNRILQWIPAQPCDISDAEKLSKIYAPDLDIEKALLERVVKKTSGVTRRICTTLTDISHFAKNNGQSSISDQDYTNPIFTQQIPRGRPSV